MEFRRRSKKVMERSQKSHCCYPPAENCLEYPRDYYYLFPSPPAYIYPHPFLVSSSLEEENTTNHSSNNFNSVLVAMSIIPSLFTGGRRTNVFDPFSMEIWDPFQDFPFSSTAVANLPSTARDTAALVNARVDWKETPEAHVFKADLPGLRKEEIKVEVEDGRVLQISGERSKENEETSDKWHRVERSSGKFMRRFRLPENAKMDQVKACMENGVLVVTVPKEEEKKPEVKAIEIGGGSSV